MARNKDIRYVQFYTAGSAAPQIQRQEEQKVLPKGPAAPEKRIPLPVDLVSICGMIVCVSLLVAICVGAAGLYDLNQQVLEMENRVGVLHVENEALRTEYERGYDLDEIRAAATAMGMIPSQDAEHVQVSVDVPAPEAQPSWLELLLRNFTQLLA